MIDFGIASLKNALAIVVCLLLVTVCLAQGKPPWLKIELQQILDLERSIVLIPLHNEPETSPISMRRDPELMRTREINSAIIAGVQNQLDVANSLFFYLTDSTSIYEGDFHGHIFNAEGQPIEITKPLSELFIAEYLDPNLMAKHEVIVHNQRRIRKQQRKGQKHQDIINKLERLIVTESDSVRVARKREKTAWHRAKIIDIMAPKFAFHKHDQSNRFWTAKEYFHAESANHRRLVIRRIQSKKIIASKNISYEVNWNFVARLHTTLDERTKYFEAFSYLNTKLKERKTELSRNLGIEVN